VYIRYFWLGNHQIYGVYIRIYTVLANPVLCGNDGQKWGWQRNRTTGSAEQMHHL